MSLVARGGLAEEAPSEPLFLQPTIYYKPLIEMDRKICLDSEKVPVRSLEDKILAVLCRNDFRKCVMQGACYVRDERGLFRLFNYYAQAVDGSPRFKIVDLNKCPYGYGVRNVCLDPYFTVAADLSLYKLGDVIFVPRLVGELMPDGEVHDGYLVIRDAGAAIKGAERFDFFTGLSKPFSQENPFYRLGFASVKNRFEFRLATEEEAARTRERTRYPSVRQSILLPPQKPQEAIFSK